MPRVASIWFPTWPIERLARETPGSVPSHPFALVAASPRGLIISAANTAALSVGVRVNASLADTRAVHPRIAVRPANADRDHIALTRLAHWLGRYGPQRNTDDIDGAWIDVTGVPHLFGGEAALAADLLGHLRRIGITARVGIADTLGGAHALARFSTSAASPCTIAAPGATAPALAGLPSTALRLPNPVTHLLARLGLKRIGDLYSLPRPALERRFRESTKEAARNTASISANVLLRLDQALGHISEPRRPLAEPPDTTARLSFPEPLISGEGIEAALNQMTDDLTNRLDTLHQGGRRFRLTLYRVDGTATEILIGTSAPCRDALHVRRLIKEKLGSIDAGFGIDVLTLSADRLEPLEARQIALKSGTRQIKRTSLEPLIDRFANRFGNSRVLVPALYESHIPERSGVLVSAVKRMASRSKGATHNPHPAPIEPLPWASPPLLLSPPEPIEVVAEIPEGAPQRVRWRRLSRRIVRTEGPERISPEWWHSPTTREDARDGPPTGNANLQRLLCGVTRDYYRLEDESGAGYWVFRAGLYTGEDERVSPRWFMHGLFP